MYLYNQTIKRRKSTSYGRQRRGGTLEVVGVAILSQLFKLATNHTNKSPNFYCKIMVLRMCIVTLLYVGTSTLR